MQPCYGWGGTWAALLKKVKEKKKRKKNNSSGLLFYFPEMVNLIFLEKFWSGTSRYLNASNRSKCLTNCLKYVQVGEDLEFIITTHTCTNTQKHRKQYWSHFRSINGRPESLEKVWKTPFEKRENKINSIKIMSKYRDILYVFSPIVWLNFSVPCGGTKCVHALFFFFF